MGKISLAVLVSCIAVLVMHLTYSGVTLPKFSKKEGSNKQQKILQFIESHNPLSFPRENARKLYEAGLSANEIVKINRVYNNNAYIYVRLQEPILDDEIFSYARYASVVTGEGIDPYLIHAIAKIEPMPLRGTGGGIRVGGCRFSPTEKDGIAVVSLRREEEAFHKIVASINAGKRPRNRMHISYPAVSCHYEGGHGGAVSLMQILPSLYLHYEPEVRRVENKDKFADPFFVRNAFLATAAILRDMAKYHKALPKDVTIKNPKLFKKVAATYNAGKNWKYHTGDDRYGGRVLKIAQKLFYKKYPPFQF